MALPQLEQQQQQLSDHSQLLNYSNNSSLSQTNVVSHQQHRNLNQRQNFIYKDVPANRPPNLNNNDSESEQTNLLFDKQQPQHEFVSPPNNPISIAPIVSNKTSDHSVVRSDTSNIAQEIHNNNSSNNIYKSSTGEYIAKDSTDDVSVNVSSQEQKQQQQQQNFISSQLPSRNNNNLFINNKDGFHNNTNNNSNNNNNINIVDDTNIASHHRHSNSTNNNNNNVEMSLTFVKQSSSGWKRSSRLDSRDNSNNNNNISINNTNYNNNNNTGALFQRASTGGDLGHYHSKSEGRSGNGAGDVYISREDDSKHPLNSTWCLFMLQDAEKRTHESWNENQMEVHEFATVEDFWCMINYIHPPSQIGVSDYSLFKKGLKPAWEDPAVCWGGRWVAKLPSKLKAVDELWVHVAIAMIGESLNYEYGSGICGAVVSVRPRSLKISLWIDTRDEVPAVSIGLSFQKLLLAQLDPKERKLFDVSFQSFKDNIEYKLTASAPSPIASNLTTGPSGGYVPLLNCGGESLGHRQVESNDDRVDGDDENFQQPPLLATASTVAPDSDQGLNDLDCHQSANGTEVGEKDLRESTQTANESLISGTSTRNNTSVSNSSQMGRVK